MALTLTDQDVDDASQVDPLLELIPSEIEQFAADGACDREPTTMLSRRATRDSDIAVVIPQRTSSMALTDLIDRIAPSINAP